MVPDTSDPTVKHSDCYSVPPSVDEHAYIQPRSSLGVTVVPLMENDSTSCVSALGSPMDTEYDNVTVCSEPATCSGLDCDATPRTLTECISRLLYATAFSHLYCSRVPPPVAPNRPCSQIPDTPSHGQDTSAFCADDLSNEQQNLPLFFEPMSATFARPMSPLPPSSPGFVDDCCMDWSDDVSVPPLPLPSSPAQSSSPPNFFTSSPTRTSLHKSPPTSPIPTKELGAVPSVVRANPFKRPRSPGTAETTAGDQDYALEEPAKKARYARGIRPMTLTLSIEVENLRSSATQTEHASFPT